MHKVVLRLLGSRISMVDGPNASWNPLDAASFAIEPLHESGKDNNRAAGQKGEGFF